MSAECSPDRIARQLENAFRSDWTPDTTVSAEVDANNRRLAPAREVAEPPRRDRFATDAAYFTAVDEWQDTLPTARSWRD